MSDSEYLTRYRGNLTASGALIEDPDEPIWLIAFTGWRESDPWHVGRWVSDQLEQDERFTGLLVPFYDRVQDTTWLRLDPVCVEAIAEEIYGRGVYDRVQDLFDLIDDQWKRMHPGLALIPKQLVVRLRDAYDFDENDRSELGYAMDAVIDAAAA